MDQNTTSSTPRTGPRASWGRWRGAAALLATASLLVGCGGGGGAAATLPRRRPLRQRPQRSPRSPSRRPIRRSASASPRRCAPRPATSTAPSWPASPLTWTSSNPRRRDRRRPGVVTGVSAGSATHHRRRAAASPATRRSCSTVVRGRRGCVVIDKPSVFLTASGQSARLAAQVLRRAGRARPRHRALDLERARPGVGRRQRAADRRSSPSARRRSSPRPASFARRRRWSIVATPQPGALLVTDAQVVAVGALQPRAGGAIGPGSHYEVTLRDIAAPLPGTIAHRRRERADRGQASSPTRADRCRPRRDARAAAAAAAASAPTTSASPSTCRASASRTRPVAPRPRPQAASLWNAARRTAGAVRAARPPARCVRRRSGPGDCDGQPRAGAGSASRSRCRSRTTSPSRSRTGPATASTPSRARPRSSAAPA